MKKHLALFSLIFLFNVFANAGQELGPDGYFTVWWPGDERPEQCRARLKAEVAQGIALYPEGSTPRKYAKLAEHLKVSTIGAVTEYRYIIGEQHQISPGQLPGPGESGFIGGGSCYYLVQRGILPFNQNLKDKRKICGVMSYGSVIDFNKKTVVESIPIEGTNFSLNYSSEFNSKINLNRTISNEYNLFKSIRLNYKINYKNSLNGELIGATDMIDLGLTSSFSNKRLLSLDSTLWQHDSFKSIARVTSILTEFEVSPGNCYYLEIPHPSEPSTFEERCSFYMSEHQIDSSDSTIVLYHPETWGLHGWTFSEHHYFESSTKTLFAGSGEKLQYSAFKTVQDSALGIVNVVISKLNEQELFIFDQQGRHLETRDAILGHVIHKFHYDPSNGKLISISDRFLSNTRFEYEGNNLSKIVSPFGVETIVNVVDGKIASALDPEDKSYIVTYNDQDLIGSFKSSNDVETTFFYNTDGELVAEEKNNGLIQSFTKIISANFTEMVKYVGYGLDRRIQILTTQNGTEINTIDANNNIISQEKRSNEFQSTERNYENERIKQNFSYSEQWGEDRIIPNQNTRIVSESGQDITETVDQLESNIYEDESVLALTQHSSSINVNGRNFSNTYTKSDNTFRTVDIFGVQTSIELNSKNLVSQISSIDKYPTDFEYDTYGRLTKVKKGTQFESYTYDSKGYLESTNNNKGNLTQFVRNSKGQITKRILPNLDEISYTYTSGGEVKSIKAPNDKIHYFEMDLGDYISQALTPNGKSTSYNYDSDKRLTKVTKPSGKEISYEYENGKSDLKRIVTLYGETVINSRDVRSRIRSITSPDNIKTDLTWASNEIQSQTWYDGEELIAKLNYDFANDAFKIKSIKLNDQLIASYSYQNGLLKSIDNLGFTYSHEVGDKLHIQKISNNSGFLFNYTEQDSASGERPEQITSARVIDGVDTQLFVTLKRSYDNFGQATEFTTTTLNISSGTYNSYFSLLPKYDKNDRLIRLDKTRKSFVNGEEVSSIDFVNQYLYPAKSNNNIKTYQQSISVNHQQTPLKRTFASHNDDDQLTKLEGSIKRDYKYNEDGEVSKMSNCYGDTTYEYDFYGNLKKVVLPNGKKIEYKVDAFNRRFKKLVDDQVVEYYLWYDQIRLAAILDGNKSVKVAYVYGSESSHVPGYIIKDGQTFKIIHDPGTNSVRYVVDSANAMIMQESEYDEHGNIMKQTNAGFQPLGYAGGLYDADTKFLKFGARDYDPTIGRWTTKDPIGFAGGDTNLYAYVGGDPMSYNDPTGEFKVHGNWCGEDWTGGKEGPYVRGGEYSSPIDGLDMACKVHDMCYNKCRTSETTRCDMAAQSECFKQCDNELAAGAGKFGGATANIIQATMLRPGTRPPNGIDGECACSAK